EWGSVGTREGGERGEVGVAAIRRAEPELHEVVEDVRPRPDLGDSLYASDSTAGDGPHGGELADFEARIPKLVGHADEKCTLALASFVDAHLARTLEEVTAMRGDPLELETG